MNISEEETKQVELLASIEFARAVYERAPDNFPNAKQRSEILMSIARQISEMSAREIAATLMGMIYINIKHPNEGMEEIHLKADEYLSMTSGH